MIGAMDSYWGSLHIVFVALTVSLLTLIYKK